MPLGHGPPPPPPTPPCCPCTVVLNIEGEAHHRVKGFPVVVQLQVKPSSLSGRPCKEHYLHARLCSNLCSHMIKGQSAMCYSHKL